MSDNTTDIAGRRMNKIVAEVAVVLERALLASAFSPLLQQVLYSPVFYPGLWFLIPRVACKAYKQRDLLTVRQP